MTACAITAAKNPSIPTKTATGSVTITVRERKSAVRTDRADRTDAEHANENVQTTNNMLQESTVKIYFIGRFFFEECEDMTKIMFVCHGSIIRNP